MWLRKYGRRDYDESEGTCVGGSGGAYWGLMLRMKVRERMGTSVRTMVKVMVTTDGDQR